MSGAADAAQSDPVLADPVLVLNAGSSSLKFALVDARTGDRPFTGLAERIGTSEATLAVRRAGRDPVDQPMPGAGHREVVAAVLDALQPAGAAPVRLCGVGHRVVHGGEHFAESTLIDDQVMAAIEDVSRLAPLHNPAALLGIRAVRAVLPEAPQVAVFDTAFHQTMPARAYRYAVPDEWYPATASDATGSMAPATGSSASGPPSCSAGRPPTWPWWSPTWATGAARQRCSVVSRSTRPWASRRSRAW